MRAASRFLFTFFGALTFFILGGSISTAHALQFDVTRTDDPAPDACLSGVDCSLREAVIAANANAGPDVIVLQAGTYLLSIPGAGGAEEGDLDVTESLTVQGAGKATTIIDTHPDFNDRIFQVDTGGNLVSIDFTASDLTLQGGETDGGGGAVSISGFDPQAIFTNIIVQENQAAGNGGGIFFSSGQGRQFVLKGSDVLNNSSASGGGGGVYCTGAGISCDVEESLFSGNESTGGSGGGMLIGTGGDGSLRHTIVRTVFENNIAGGPFGGSGGGLNFGSSKGLQLTEVRFTGNIANGIQGNGGQGGGAFVSSGGQAVDVENCIFQDNQNDGHGGGLYVSLGGTVTVTGSTFDNNESRVGGSGRGGGLYVNNGNNVTVTQGIFRGNTADAEGGGAYFESFNAGGPAVTNSTFSGNTAALSGGGAYFTGNNTGPSIVNDTFSGNASAASGGGAYFTGANPPAIAKSIFSANTAAGEGGGAYFTSGTGPSITNSTFSGNTAEFSGGGMTLSVGSLSSLNNLTVVQNTSTTGAGGGVNSGFMTVFRNSLFFQNSAASGATDDCAGPMSGFVTSDGYNIWGPQAGNADCPVVSGGINPNDQFGVDPLIGALANNGGATQTHALLLGSPAIDGGNPAGCKDANGVDLTEDQRGEPRPFGPRCDIGAYELQATPPACVPEDCDDDNACNGVETCQNDQCMPGTPVICSDDGNQCNGAFPVCDPSTGQCADSIPPVTCSDDGNQCNGTSPVCNPSTGQCADSVPPVTCSDDGNQCNGTSPICDPSTGQCADSVPPVVCDDGNVCNGTETCDPANGCQPGTPLNCQDGDACNGVETCHPTMGCQSGTAPDCDDNDPCTADSCDAIEGCRHDPLPDGDNDGICDANDACPNDANNDVDLDGVCGDVDNCPEDSNSDQTDTDNDGIGDACDTGGEPDACSVDFTGLPNSHCSRTTTVNSMTGLTTWISGPRTTNLKVSKHRSGGSYNFNGSDLNLQTSCEVRFETGATFFNVGDADITASAITIQNDILFSPNGTMHLRAGRLIEVRRASLAKLSVIAESPVVLYRGDVNDKMDGLVALCGRYVEIGAASTTKAAKVFIHATHDLVIGGDILSAGQVTLISDDDMELRTSNNIGTFYRPIGSLTANVAGLFDDRGDIVANGTVTVNTGSFTLNRSHFFDVDGECRVTGVKKAGSRPIQGTCRPGIQ